MRTSLQATFVFLLCSYSIFIYRELEPTVHPVISSFEVSQMVSEGSSIKMRGTMYKSRPCEFKGLAIYGARGVGVATLLDYRFLDNEARTSKVHSRAVGLQAWGPWEIILPEELDIGRLILYSSHSCWPFWQTESKIAEIPLLEGST